MYCYLNAFLNQILKNKTLVNIVNTEMNVFQGGLLHYYIMITIICTYAIFSYILYTTIKHLCHGVLIGLEFQWFLRFVTSKLMFL